MLLRLLAGAALLLPASASARVIEPQSPAPEASPTPAADGMIVGVVVGRTTRTPLAAVEIVLSAPDATDRVTTTNASGLFRFIALPPANYAVLARHTAV